jgi:hypothetical protein
MYYGAWCVMDRNKIKERLELALGPVEKPTLEEVFKQVSTHGVLRGPVDWVFPAWMLYVEYATQRIVQTFQLSEEERRQLLDFRDTLKRLLLEAWIQAKEKLTTLYKAVVEGTYRVEGNKLYAPDGELYIGGYTPILKIRGVASKAYFPDILKLPREKLELLQLGWRASDESKNKDRPYMGTSRPWQVFAWVAVRFGELYVCVPSVNLTREGASVSVQIFAQSWRQKWSKNEAISLVVDYFRRGEWAPIFAMWLGDGQAGLQHALKCSYKVIIISKEPWRLSTRAGKKAAIVASGREAFIKLREAAGVYGELLDLLEAHKWVVVKLATDSDFRIIYKLKVKKRSINRLRETYRHIDSDTELSSETNRPNTIVVAGIAMHLHLIGDNKSVTLLAHRRVGIRTALAIAKRLESAGLKPNVVPAGPRYMVYISTTDILKLAERDETIRKTVALYLADKAKNGTPRQRKLAEKLLKLHPIFQLSNLTANTELFTENS